MLKNEISLTFFSAIFESIELVCDTRDRSAIETLSGMGVAFCGSDDEVCFSTKRWISSSKTVRVAFGDPLRCLNTVRGKLCSYVKGRESAGVGKLGTCSKKSSSIANSVCFNFNQS